VTKVLPTEFCSACCTALARRLKSTAGESPPPDLEVNAMEQTIKMTVNGKTHSVTTDARRPLLDVLREDLHLTGTKYGCGEGQCGACTVLVDGKRVYACRMAVSGVADKKIRTIEGLADGDKLHAVQQAFLADSGFQCGYCTSGMIMSAVGLLEENNKPTDPDIQEWMNRQICRCCSYASITKAVKRAVGGIS
jgi:aerobic-type carbon monoxide dehydrogenase small subunit (CoxS/CutS family)